MPGCEAQISILDLDGNYLGRWPVVKSSLSVNSFGDQIFVSERGAREGWNNLVIVNARTDEITDVIESANVYVHQAALDQETGDIYVASVYPEHGGGQRGIHGPSNRRWARQ